MRIARLLAVVSAVVALFAVRGATASVSASATVSHPQPALTTPVATPHVSAGAYHTCAVSTEGSVYCWGYGAYGSDVPAGLGPATQVSTGSPFFSCALKVDGTVTCWGTDYFEWGVLDVPAGLDSVVAISGLGSHTCALKADGFIVCWGSPQLPAVPGGLGPVVQVSAGGVGTCVLKADETVVCWGGFNGGMSAPEGLGPIAQVSTGGSHACVLKIDGTVVCWEDTAYGSFGNAAVPDGLSLVAQVSAGGGHTCAVKTNGTVVCWGDPGSGGTTVPDGLNSVVQVSAGFSQTCALKSDGSVVCWGYNNFGQATPPEGLNLGITDTGTPAAISATGLWLGLKNSDDVGTKFDLLVEVLKNGDVVGSGQLDAMPGGSSGFNNAVMRTVGVAMGSTTYGAGDVLGLRLSVRIAVGVSGHRSGTARLWYGDAGAATWSQATVDGQATSFYLISGSALSASPGTVRKTSDVLVDRLKNGNPFKPFGTWTKVF